MTMTPFFRVSYNHDCTPDASLGYEECVIGNAAYFADRESAEAFVAECVQAWSESTHEGCEDDEPVTADDYTIEEYRADWLDDNERDQVLAVI